MNQRKSGFGQSFLNSRNHDFGDGEVMYRFSRRSWKKTQEIMSPSMFQSSYLGFALVCMRDVGKETANIDSTALNNSCEHAGRIRQHGLLHV